jgi:transposase
MITFRHRAKLSKGGEMAALQKADEKLNRQQRKELVRRLWSSNPGLDVVHRNAAGIDVGNEEHYVAIAPTQDEVPVQRFNCFTAELIRMAVWLKGRGVQTVAMQSTGVYWIPLYDILEEHGIEVYLVNARDTKNLPGRKTDVQESQWLLKLHTYGLLRNSFRPASEIRVLRAYWRQRDQHVKTAGQCVQRIQKALTQMNLQLANVISDLSGKTGLQILRAVVNGERDPAKLADFRDPRIKASREDIIASLRGNWRAELLFQVKQELARYDFCQTQIAECDRELEQQLQSLPELRAGEEKSGTKETQRPPKKRKRRKDGNIPRFDLHHELQRISGVDLTRIDGIDVMTGQTVISEVGLDMSRWPSENHFASWLGLCPSNELSGGRILKKRTRKVVNRAATAFRMAASTLRTSQSYLGAKFRRLRSRLGPPKAITAMARTLAILFYRMLKFGQDYLDRGTEFYEQRQRDQQLQYLQKKAAQLGLQVVALPETPK